MVNNPITYFFKLLLLILATLFSLRILFVLVNRLPGVVLAISLIALALCAFAYRRGGWHAIGLRSRKAAMLAMIACLILTIVSTGILLNIN